MTCPRCAATKMIEMTERTQPGYRRFRCSACRRRYKLNLRDLEEMFLERGFEFTHETVRDWEACFAVLLGCAE